MTAGEACEAMFSPSPDLHTEPFMAPRTLISPPAIPCCRKSGQRVRGKKKVEYTGKVKINQVEFLPLDGACKAIFLPTPALKTENV